MTIGTLHMSVKLVSSTSQMLKLTIVEKKQFML